MIEKRKEIDSEILQLITVLYDAVMEASLSASDVKHEAAKIAGECAVLFDQWISTTLGGKYIIYLYALRRCIDSSMPKLNLSKQQLDLFRAMSVIVMNVCRALKNKMKRHSYNLEAVADGERDARCLSVLTS